jgi:two-component system cell cycle sensor histidine kinase/response regulator CckA
MKTDQPLGQASTKSAGAEDLLQLQAAALEAAANPIVISRVDGTIIQVNKAFEQLSGYTRGEALGQNTRLLKSDQQSPAFYKRMWETILSGKIWQGELVNRRKDGSLYQEEMTITPVKTTTGEITHFIAIKLDITERKLAEERVCRLAQIVQNSSELIAVTDFDDRIVFANYAMHKASGYEEGELVGESFRDALISSNNRPEFVEEIRSRTFFGGGWRGECFCRRKDGSDFPVFLSTGQVKDNQGRVIGIFGIAQDITERKHLEEQLAVSRKMEAVGQLAGGIAHDFNNLLAVIMGYSELLLEAFPPDDPRNRKVHQIKKAGDRAASLTRQLLAFSRKQVVRPRVLDLNALVDDLSKMLSRIVREDIELTTILRPEIGHIVADPGQVEQVIINLVVNARDAIPNGGKVIIETANSHLDEHYCRSHPTVKPGRYVMVAISDTGIGMDAKTQARIFEPFFTTKEQGKGTGLGLATVYGIVKQSEGNIWVYSQVGKGTTFKVYFPLIDRPPELVWTDRDRVESLRGSETILLAEDAEDLRELTRSLLENNGYRVIVAENTEGAIRLAEQENEPIHLLLTDVVMPGMNGRQLAERIKANHPAVRVLYMSGYPSDVIVHHGILEQGIFLIEKPFSEATLMRKLREVLEWP